MSGASDHYEVLGVPRDASTADIERARKRLALIWHPDRNKSPDAAQRFDEVQKAAEVLRNPAARAAYDRDFALQVAMSLPRDLRDRRPPEPPPAPASSAPGWTAPASMGRAHVRPRRLRGRTWAAARKARLSGALAGLVAMSGVAAVFLASQWHPAAPPHAVPRHTARPAGVGTAGRTGGGTGMFPLPQYTHRQAVLPVGSGQVLSIGPGITLLAAGGHVIWHEAASVGSLDTNPASRGGPHAMHGCVVDGSTSGRQYDFISLASGQQSVVDEKKAPAAGSMALASNRVALPDGTIRNPCTGAVLDRAAPGWTFTTAECLTGSVVIGTGRRGQMAWKKGHKLWQQRTDHPLVCDHRGSVLMLNPAAHKISLIDPLSGRARWTARDPGCPRDCGSPPGSPPQVLGSGGTVLFSDADQVLALARGNGRLLWRKPSQCALATRAKPAPEVLLGSCPGQAGAASGTASVATPATGAVVGTHTVGGNGCGPGGQWAASSRELLVVCPGPSTGQHSYLAQLMNW